MIVLVIIGDHFNKELIIILVFLSSNANLEHQDRLSVLHSISRLDPTISRLTPLKRSLISEDATLLVDYYHPLVD